RRLFFFSSRRRHTRCYRDWSSDVCSSDLIHDTGKSVAQAVKEAEGKVGAPVKIAGFVRYALGEGIEKQESDFAAEVAAASGKKRSEERRVGKEGRCGWVGGQ